MEYLILSSVPLVLLLIAINPKFGTLLIWPVLFTYPHNFWSHHNYLPLNIGIDDLFSLFLFLAVFFRRNIFGEQPIRFSFAMRVITIFTLISIVAHVSGLSEVFGTMQTTVIKDMLKNIVYWSLFYAILHCIDDERDLKRQMGAFSFAAVIGASIVILQRFYPYPFDIFSVPKGVQFYGMAMEIRAAGAFMNPNAAAAVLSCSLPLLVANLRIYETLISKMIIFAFCFILLVAVLFTQSRSGLLALFVGFGSMMFFGKSKATVPYLIIAVMVIGLVFTQVWEATQVRIEEIYSTETGEIAQNIEGRFESWKTYLQSATIKDYLIGQGSFVASVQTGLAESHSLYVSLPTIYGIGGCVWAVVCAFLYLKKAFRIRRNSDLYLSVISDACIWALLAWGVYGIASDAISSQYTRYLLFYFVVILDRLEFFERKKESIPEVMAFG